MLSILLIILPIFALIFAGWGARKIGIFGPHASKELNRFVVFLAMPALLFKIVAEAQWAEIWQPHFIGAFGLGVVGVFILAILIRRFMAFPMADATINGFAAAFANTAFIGFPLTVAVLGPWALTPALIATIITVCILFAISLVMVETSLQASPSILKTTGKVLQALGKNPMVVAPSIGAIFLGFNLTIPEPASVFIDFLSATTSPCALVTIGLFLADKPETETPPISDTALLVSLKLIVQPLLTWYLAAHVFRLSQPLTDAAVLIAALPTGTGPFVLAELYQRQVCSTSRTILISTVLSVITITTYLTLR